MDTLNQYESTVRSYSRSFPTIFSCAKNDLVTSLDNKQYIDFFASAGALNYGHNNEKLKQTIIEHLESDKLIHFIDACTDVRENFLERFNQIILQPRGLNYKIQFTGPTGTNAVEAALKLAMINTGRSNIICFTNAYHGHTIGALSITSNSYYRDRLRIPLLDRCFMPFDGYFGPDINTSEMLKKMLLDKGSGVSKPAAIILESIQGEGGINVASKKWLREIRTICDEFDIILIFDEIQVGNGRTGDFFSFEASGIQPDIALLSKSIGGGLPLSLLLMKPELDNWNTGEHTGTFRSNNLALAVANSLLDYWLDDTFSKAIKEKENILTEKLQILKALNIPFRGRGLMYGIELESEEKANAVAQNCFKNGLIIECAGANNNVLKILPPLTIAEDHLEEGLSILLDCINKEEVS